LRIVSITPTVTATGTETPTPTALPTGAVTIPYGYDVDYTYDPLYRLTAADYSTGEYYHYAYDPVGNASTSSALRRLWWQTNHLGSNNYTYDVARGASLKYPEGIRKGQPPDQRGRGGVDPSLSLRTGLGRQRQPALGRAEHIYLRRREPADEPQQPADGEQLPL
jgi:hypothetical protein